MWQNTYLALRQVADDFNQRLESNSGLDNGEEDACEPLSRDELQAMRSTFDLMYELLEAAGVDEDCNDPGQAAVDAITPEEG